jgi:hypothetical protein
MRTLLALCLFVSAPLFAAAPANTVKGRVLEVTHAAGYTYLRMDTQAGETWAAISQAAVEKGATVTLEKVMVMHDFESKTLHKTFPKILFGALAGPAATHTGMSMASAHSGVSSAMPVPAVDKPVAKATGANAKTVAEIVTQKAALKDKSVLVRGKIVKFNAGIMGKNWIHLRDGSGSAADGSNDILVTTSQMAKVSDLVTVAGVVRLNQDFGAGYVYPVLIENAKLKP